MNKITQAIIMCGGKGTRIKSITKDLIPKCMIKFNDKSFLEILINKINNIGIKKIIFCTGHHSDQIERHINDLNSYKSYDDIKFLVSRENFPLGTAGALKLCSNLLEGKNSIILNGDTYVNYNLNNYINWHINQNYKISIMLSFIINASKFGSVSLIKSKIKNFEEKQSHFLKYVYNGIFISNNEDLEKIELKFSNVEDTFFQNNINKLYGYKTFCSFYDIGTLEGYKRAQKYLVV